MFYRKKNRHFVLFGKINLPIGNKKVDNRHFNFMSGKVLLGRRRGKTKNKKKMLALSENIALDVVDCVDTLLGVDIDSNLSFISHITRICKKAGKHIQVLRRLTFLRPKQSCCYLNLMSYLSLILLDRVALLLYVGY